MQWRGCAKVHQLHFGIGQHVFDFAEDFDAGAKVDIAGVFDVARDTGEDAIDRKADGVAHGHDTSRFVLQVGPQVGGAHEPEADDGDVYLCILHFKSSCDFAEWSSADL